jgi:hypothetical protein
MGEAVRQLTIVGQQEQSFCPEVEPADRRHQEGDLLQLGQVVDRGPLEAVLACGQNFVGLVKHPVNAGRFGPTYQFAVDGDLVRIGVDLAAGLFDYLAIDRDAALTDPDLRLPA